MRPEDELEAFGRHRAGYAGKEIRPVSNGCPIREYSRAEGLVNNLPYILMIALGSVLLLIGLEFGKWGWMAAVAYLAYGLIGVVWIIVFLCPFCGFHGTRRCPCGYGEISAKLRTKEAPDLFRQKFKKHIAVIVPLWFIPLMGGGVVLVSRFSWWFLGLLAAFSVNAFVILPQLSKQHGCVDCAQSADCPWMGRKKRRPVSSELDSS